jgi:hypothetical protein
VSRSAAWPGFKRRSHTACTTFKRSSSVIDMVIVPRVFMASAPQAMLATSLNRKHDISI